MGWSGKCALLLFTFALFAGSSSAQQFRSPVAYCRAVGTIDRPDARYVGPKLPGWMATQLNLRPNQANLMEWRCANGSILACVYGANIPCDSKANTSRVPTQAIREYCRTNAGSTFVPMVVTGHTTSVSWACTGTRPVVIASDPVDAQGYVRQFWKVVAP